MIDLASNVTGTLPIANGGTSCTIRFVNGGGVTEADMWRLTSGFNSDQDPISSNLEILMMQLLENLERMLFSIWTFPIN